jgi:large subunit ribosomal protein L17
MRHQKSGRKLNRNSSHRKAMFRNMVTSLLRHERITTTAAKAKELRGEVERTISVGVRLGDLLDKPKDTRTREEQARFAHAMAHAAKTIRDRDVLHKLFEDIAPRVRQRPGGWTRVIHLIPRKGDAAPMAILELVDLKKVEAGLGPQEGP